MKFISLFSGGGLVDVGAKAAGYDLLAANEIDPTIADVYRRNHGDHIRVGDVLEQDPQDYPDCDLLHASPVCTNASNANVSGVESKLDIACAKKTAEFIRHLKPKYFTLENVAGYRKFAAYREIINALDELGYWHNASILNSADFGVPQTRRRLFVRAVRGGFVPPLPPPVRWIGWLEAVADIVHTFPDTEFAPWQIARLPEHEMNFIFNENRSSLKWIQETDVIGEERPAMTVCANKHLPRGFIMRDRRFGGQMRGEPWRLADQPSSSVMASHPPMKAFVVSSGNASREVTIRNEDEPIYTITASMDKTPARAWLRNGRIVRFTPRGMARLQSVPDDFILPNETGKALEIIGNGVPPLMYQHIASAFVPLFT